MHRLLSIAEMYAADRAAMAGGISGEALMDAAGWQVAVAIRRRYRPRPVLVLCGPGNNGGDGFVVARILAWWGWPVRLAMLGDPARLAGDAARMAKRWNGPVLPLSADFFDGLDDDALVVDALFGAGLSRPLEGVAAQVVACLQGWRGPVVSIDIPSGVDGDSGAIPGVAVNAALTVTFFRRKPGHLLFPGRMHCGEVVVGDIGIPDTVLDILDPALAVNGPALWRNLIPWPQATGHKYDRGHLVVAGGDRLTGAARLAARAGRRTGAGLVTILAPDAAVALYRQDWPGTMVLPAAEWGALLADRRVTAAVIGPGLGVGGPTAALAMAALAAGKRCVLDADALSCIALDDLRPFGGNAVLTPHDGEFQRLFPTLPAGDRLARARAAAQSAQAVVLVKGPDTVVAAPDGRAAICGNAPPDLASGGTGDVLAGIIGGLLAQGMPCFAAACCGAWLHGELGRRVGPGLIAEDLIAGMPAIWKALAAERAGVGPQDGFLKGWKGPGRRRRLRSNRKGGHHG